MNNVKVKRQELLTKVRANRDAHYELFQKAQAGYRQLVIEELDKMLADAKEGLPIQRSVTLTEPSNHDKDYDRIITMLEMSVDETIMLRLRRKWHKSVENPLGNPMFTIAPDLSRDLAHTPCEQFNRQRRSG